MSTDSHHVKTLEAARALTDILKKKNIATPRYHVVLGSGLGQAFNEVDLHNFQFLLDIPFQDIPGLSVATVEGHMGLYRVLVHQKTKCTVIFQLGRKHGYEGLTPKEAVRPVMCSRLVGTTHFILTNAAGSLNKKFKIGSAMLFQDHVNLTGLNPLIGPNPLGLNEEPIGPRFQDMSETYDSELQAKLKVHLKKEKVKVFEGIYLGVMGPSFETPAEVKLYSSWGLDAVGMSTVWEALALKHSGATLGGFSLISNMGCGLVNKEKLDHHDVLRASKISARQMLQALLTLIHEECDS